MSRMVEGFGDDVDVEAGGVVDGAVVQDEVPVAQDAGGVVELVVGNGAAAEGLGAEEGLEVEDLDEVVAEGPEVAAAENGGCAGGEVLAWEGAEDVAGDGVALDDGVSVEGVEFSRLADGGGGAVDDACAALLPDLGDAGVGLVGVC